jgi:hypothetical protein
MVAREVSEWKFTPLFASVQFCLRSDPAETIRSQ